jgi:hypothetical protein
VKWHGVSAELSEAEIRDFPAPLTYSKYYR